LYFHIVLELKEGGISARIFLPEISRPHYLPSIVPLEKEGSTLTKEQ